MWAKRPSVREPPLWGGRNLCIGIADGMAALYIGIADGISSAPVLVRKKKQTRRQEKKNVTGKSPRAR